MKDILISIIRKFDNNFKGILELEYKNRQCSKKQFIKKLVYEDMPIWIEENYKDIEYVKAINKIRNDFINYLSIL